MATDVGIGVPVEHGLHSTLIALRLARSLGVDAVIASEAYFGCLLFYVGCTATANVAGEIFADESALTNYATPHRFGPRRERMSGMLQAIAPPDHGLLTRAALVARSLPKLAREFSEVVAANCEVAQILADRLGLPAAHTAMFAHIGERWDGQGEPGHVKGDELSLPMRIVHVARDAAFQSMLGGSEYAAQMVSERAGGAFDPVIAGRLADRAAEILAFDSGASMWEETVASEPAPNFMLEGETIDQALAAIGDFGDLASPYMTGHSRGVADLAARAAHHYGLQDRERVAVRRAALVHDVGRVAVPLGVWHKTSSLSQDDWEQIRLHAYQSERILVSSPFLAAIARIAGTHHERLDGSGYHRGMPAPGLSRAERLLAAADICQALAEPRPHRAAFDSDEVARTLTAEVRAGHLDGDAVAAVLEATGLPVPRLERPAGLTEREAEVIGLVARGLQTKQVGRTLNISAKTADRHIQNAYRKIGVSSRAAATLFAMQYGLVAWGELPISRPVRRP